MVNYKKFITLLLIFSVYMIPFNTQAAGFGPWTITNSVAQGASTILTGSKEVILNGAKKIATGTAKITPTAAQVSKVLARGAAGYALSVAVEQLLGAVDWVLDPANNQVVYYKEPTEVKNCQTDQCKGEYIWYPDNSLTNGNRVYYSAPSQSVAISVYRSFMLGYGYSQANINITSTTESQNKVQYHHSSSFTNEYGERVHFSGTIVFNRVLNPNAEPEVDERERKTLPLETVAQQVISNAESGDPNAQVVTTAAAADIINEAETDNVKARPIVQQLENTQSIPTDQTAKGDAVPKDTDNPASSPTATPTPTDLTLDFPIFCDWAPSVCQAAKEVIALPITLTNWWDSATTSISESWTWAKSRYESAVTSISEFFSQETNTDTNIDIDPTNVTDITDTTISFSNQCPAPITLADFSYHGITQKWEMNFSPWCDVISTFIKPIVIAMASFSAVLIVSGVRENG